MTVEVAIRIIDEMLCGGWYGKNLGEDKDHWFEILITEEQVEAMEVFHSAAKELAGAAVE